MNIMKIVFASSFFLCLTPAAVGAEDCSKVSGLLNSRIEELKVEGLMEAAERYEFGKCVKPDWEKSAQYYQRAALGKVPKAALRLTALFAVENRDPAAALYWAARNPAILSKECLTAENPIKNANGFIEELKTWPRNKLIGCTYQAGLASRVMENFNQWPNGILYQLIGDGGFIYEAEINMRINSTNGSIEWFDNDQKKEVVSQLVKGSNEPDLSNMPDREAPLFSFWSAGIAGLKEFGRPPRDESAWSREIIIIVHRSERASRMPIQIGISQ